MKNPENNDVCQVTECPKVYGRNGAFGAPMFNVRCSIGTAPLEVTIARVPASQKVVGCFEASPF